MQKRTTVLLMIKNLFRRLPIVYVLGTVVASIGMIIFVSILPNTGYVEPSSGAGPTHIHTTLNVSAGNAKLVVPGDIGMNKLGGGHGNIHTHETDGVIHLESPIGESFTLAQLLDEWGIGSDESKLCTALAKKSSCSVAVVNKAGDTLTLDTVFVDNDELTLRLT